MTTIPLREGNAYSTECGAVIKHAHLDFQWDSNTNHLAGLDTIKFCPDCVTAALRSVRGRRYVYGISEAQTVPTKKRTEEYVS